MQIIKDKQLIANDWTYVDEASEIPRHGNITVSLDCWKKQRPHLLNRSGKTGVRLAPEDDSRELSGLLSGIELIELNFPGFGDGRLFSHARLLRSRLGYQGEIRAVGNFLADQVYFLTRVGVNAFLMENQQQIPLALSCMDDFSVNYQISSL
ncbi:MAG: DUF934 domain-containing protein [Methylomonas sp.]|jgi:uncharacterized protein (DUF934 family)